MVVRTAAFLVLAAAATPALADTARYAGPHPLPADARGSFCYIGVPHAHSFAPDPADELVRDGAALVFVGDPLERGYEGPVVPYRGPHPAAAGERCERPGDHFHLDVPADLDAYVERRGAYAHRETLRALERDRRARAEAQRAEAREAAERARREAAVARAREHLERQREAAARRAEQRAEPTETAPEREARRSSEDQRASAHRAWMRRRRGN